MKKIFLSLCCFFLVTSLMAQNSYWVFFTDKKNTTFDPYQYFDSKAIERYHQNNANLYDISNYPVNHDYVMQVSALTEEYVGESRWFNAVGVMATEEEIAVVQKLPFVAGVQCISSEFTLANVSNKAPNSANSFNYDPTLNQIALMQGEKFQYNKINGKGVRIAVFDGGFPEVNSHPAFKHLRDNNQIIKTWNFANKTENVYGYNEHGRMVLSCIAGIMNDTTLLGLATGAEFLLARTEVEVEKKKEEVWWVQALEWADKNGASIVSSSLGYGKELYDLRNMDGKTSIVAKGASTAAKKGILVCTAMGNEGMDNQWKMLVTPADADSVLSVGAVNSLENRELYSSFGPTYDGRRKPNVVACGNDMVAFEKGNYKYAQGTSFATPMVSGFAACVKQMHPEWTAMQLLEEIEKSANHYPYYDYAFGYGVPQASYFTDNNVNKNHAFNLQEDAENIYVVPVSPSNPHKLFYHIQNGDGSITQYDVKNIVPDSNYAHPAFYISKKNLLNGQIVRFWYDGQDAEYVVGKTKLADKAPEVVAVSLDFKSDFYGKNKTQKPSPHIYSRKNSNYTCKFVLNASLVVPIMWSMDGSNNQSDRVSRSFSFSFVNNWQVAKVYGLGLRLGFGSSWYALNDFEDPMRMYENYPYKEEVDIKKFNMKTTQFDLEFFQRFILAKMQVTSFYLEPGIYGAWNTGSHLKYTFVKDGKHVRNVDKDYYRNGMNKLNYGVRLRVGFTNCFAIYGQYRISRSFKNETISDLPKWEIGIQIF